MLYALIAIAIIAHYANKWFNKPKARGMDAQLHELIDTENAKSGIARDIKLYLLTVIDDIQNDREKFSDSQLNRAQEILDRAGPNAMYWMTEIAAQLAVLSAAQINGIPTNVNVELPESATPVQVVDVVVQG
jgi:hypothetical protein